jgi:protein tyrosine phosphatase (PTP) superfamily phosphohydrolase (DUF442 family)
MNSVAQLGREPVANESVGIPRFARILSWRLLVPIGILFLTWFAWFVGYLGGNIREVRPGELVRSAQLSNTQMRTVLNEYRVRSVLNLNGKPGEADFEGEKRLCAVNGIAFASVKISAVKLPSPDDVRRIAEFCETAQRPVLIHCRQGADRTGLASTLFVTLRDNVPLDEAQASQLSWHYAHFPFGQARAMDEFFDFYRTHGNGQTLREWCHGGYSRALLGTAQNAPDHGPLALTSALSAGYPRLRRRINSNPSPSGRNAAGSGATTMPG